MTIVRVRPPAEIPQGLRPPGPVIVAAFDAVAGRAVDALSSIDGRRRTLGHVGVEFGAAGEPFDVSLMVRTAEDVAGATFSDLTEARTTAFAARLAPWAAILQGRFDALRLARISVVAWPQGLMPDPGGREEPDWALLEALIIDQTAATQIPGPGPEARFSLAIDHRRAPPVLDVYGVVRAPPVDAGLLSMTRVGSWTSEFRSAHFIFDWLRDTGHRRAARKTRIAAAAAAAVQAFSPPTC